MYNAIQDLLTQLLVVIINWNNGTYIYVCKYTPRAYNIHIPTHLNTAVVYRARRRRVSLELHWNLDSEPFTFCFYCLGMYYALLQNVIIIYTVRWLKWKIIAREESNCWISNEKLLRLLNLRRYLFTGR